MVIQRSRRWVKERIPSFICRETKWWVSRWIQCNVFLCPECRKEYRSLKNVWDRLDDWQIEDSDSPTEAKFMESFRQKYPSALQEVEEEPAGLVDWLPKMAYLTVVVMLGLIIFWQPRIVPNVTRTVQSQAPTVPNNETERLAKAVPSESARSESPQEGFKLPNQISPRTVKRNLEGSMRPWSRNLPVRGGGIRMTSTAPEPSSLPRSTNLLRRRTLEVNDMPVAGIELSGFETLTLPFEAERPY